MQAIIMGQTKHQFATSDIYYIVLLFPSSHMILRLGERYYY